MRSIKLFMHFPVIDFSSSSESLYPHMTLCKTVRYRSRRRSLAGWFHCRWVLIIIARVYFHIICLKLHLVDPSDHHIHIVTTQASSVYLHQQLREDKGLLSPLHRRERSSRVEVWKFCCSSLLTVAWRRSTSACSQSGAKVVFQKL